MGVLEACMHGDCVLVLVWFGCRYFFFSSLISLSYLRWSSFWVVLVDGVQRVMGHDVTMYGLLLSFALLMGSRYYCIRRFIIDDDTLL